jgi:hypothetical protein
MEVCDRLSAILVGAGVRPVQMRDIRVESDLLQLWMDLPHDMTSLMHHIVGDSRLLVGMRDYMSSKTDDDEGGDDDHQGGDGGAFTSVPPPIPTLGDGDTSSSVPPPHPLGVDVDECAGDHGNVRDQGGDCASPPPSCRPDEQGTSPILPHHASPRRLRLDI